MNMMYDPLNDGISKLQLIDSMGDDSSVVRAARVSYLGDERTGKDVEGDTKLIQYMGSHGHTSPFEHTSVTFLVECPLFVRSQWHRHRMFSYNEVSRRYTSEDIKFYIPERFRVQDTRNKQGSLPIEDSPSLHINVHDIIKKGCKNSVEVYEHLLDIGIARELARMVLPQNLYTRFYVTGNMHSYGHFVKLRSDEHAQYEIRVFSDAISDIMTDLFPISWLCLLKGMK